MATKVKSIDELTHNHDVLHGYSSLDAERVTALFSSAGYGKCTLKEITTQVPQLSTYAQGITAVVLMKRDTAHCYVLCYDVDLGEAMDRKSDLQFLPSTRFSMQVSHQTKEVVGTQASIAAVYFEKYYSGHVAFFNQDFSQVYEQLR